MDAVIECDALAVDGFQRDSGVEREAREDRRLLRGVVALDIRRRIGFGVTQTLRVGEHVGEVGALGVHPVEDVVGGAVHDAHDAHHAGRRRASRAAGG